MAEQRCPECGAELPPELGQHAPTPAAGLVECPSCGARVTFEKVGSREPDDDARASDDVQRAPESVGGEERAPETFSGEETMEGVLEELEQKPGGPESAL